MGLLLAKRIPNDTFVLPDAVAKVAAGQAGPLSAMGPIPNRGDSQLLITNTALGSFGFELEEYRPGVPDFGEHSPVGMALEMTRGLLESTQEISMNGAE